MDISTFLAKLLGLYLLIMAFLYLFRRRQVKKTTKEVASSQSLLAISAEFSLIFGLVIAIDHSIWELSWRGVITALGYLLLLKGFLRFAFPDQMRRYISATIDSAYWLVFLIMTCLGIYLTYYGFIAPAS